jgi:hypothetical protein
LNFCLPFVFFDADFLRIVNQASVNFVFYVAGRYLLLDLFQEGELLKANQNAASLQFFNIARIEASSAGLS